MTAVRKSRHAVLRFIHPPGLAYFSAKFSTVTKLYELLRWQDAVCSLGSQVTVGQVSDGWMVSIRRPDGQHAADLAARDTRHSKELFGQQINVKNRRAIEGLQEGVCVPAEKSTQHANCSAVIRSARELSEHWR